MTNEHMKSMYTLCSLECWLQVEVFTKKYKEKGK